MIYHFQKFNENGLVLTNIRKNISALICVFAVLISGRVLADERVKVVASFSILGDIVQEVGGDLVEVTVLVGPDSDAHVYRAKPIDARKVHDADLLVINGLGFEGWMTRLEQSSGFQGIKVVASDGISAKPSEEHGHEDDGEDNDDHHDGDVDPHAWHSIGNVIQYANNISRALAQFQPENAAVFQQQFAQYKAKLEALDAELRAQVALIPEQRRTVITSHDAFAYLEQAYDFHFLSPQGVSTESEPSARDVAQLIRQIRQQNVKAVFLENVTDARLIQQIANETGVKAGGVLYSGALSSLEGAAPDYLTMMRHNVETLVNALREEL